jgi:uncharacterized membrane protein YbhN (UPF0104 family)
MTMEPEMTDTAAVHSSPVNPFHDPSRRSRLGKVGIWLAALALLLIVLELVGVDVGDWLSSLWDTLTEIPVQYIVAGLAFQTVQTTLTALGWYYILRAGFPSDPLRYREVLAAYAAGVAMNGFLPANIGTFVMLLMFVALIPSATFPGVLGGMVVQKIFFTVAGTAVYLYLFLSVPGSFDLQLGGAHDHPVATAVILVGGTAMLVLLARIFWRKLSGLWEKAKQGGAILADPKDYAVKVVLPSFGAWLAKLGVTAVFLAGYGIPVTIHTVMSVIGGNSLANTVSATPGGVGINQAVNVASPNSVTDTATATAYSVGQQLTVTAWNVLFGIAVVVWGFGWSGGRALVEQSYGDAKVKVAEQKEQRAAKKAEKRAARTAEGHGILHRPRRRNNETEEA